MPLTHGVNLGHVLLVPESVSSQLTMPPLRKPKMSLLPKSRSPAEIFGRQGLCGGRGLQRAGVADAQDGDHPQRRGLAHGVGQAPWDASAGRRGAGRRGLSES